MNHRRRAGSSHCFSACSIAAEGPINRHLSINWHLPKPVYKDAHEFASRSIANILLAEDDETLRRFLVAALERAGHAVTAFGDGLEAYERLMDEHFDLLLSDIVMPGLDGIELAKRAAELDPSLRIMFITGFAAVALNPAAEAPKHAKVLSKPFHLRDLVSQIDRILAA